MKLNTLYRWDCLEVMRTFEDNSIDLTVTSPPYDNLRTYNWFSWNFEWVAKELYRITKQGGVVVWVVADGTENGSETGTSFRQALYFKEIGFRLHDTMIFSKQTTTPVWWPSRYYQRFEYMFILSKWTPKKFTPITRERLNKCNDKRTIRTKKTSRNPDGTFNYRTIKINETVKIWNVWEYTVNNPWNTLESQHPAIFPEKLAEDHILSWSNEWDTVLDCFAGSGTTLKMAQKNNRNYIGIEISEEYCKIIEKRLSPLKTFIE